MLTTIVIPKYQAATLVLNKGKANNATAIPIPAANQKLRDPEESDYRR